MDALIRTDDLMTGELSVLNEIPWASNYTYLAKLSGTPAGSDRLVVYKPKKGEAPLWDFPSGTLCRREVAAYLVSEAGGWGFVPPTVLRDGPLGMGAVQLYIDHDPQTNAFDLLESHTAELRSIALFDLVVNNADRKAGHVLIDVQGGIWAVDHGICFHHVPKLRTVLWDFVGSPITEEELVPVKKLAQMLDSKSDFLSHWLSGEEIEGLSPRARALLEAPEFPQPRPGRNYPWPPV